MSMIKIPGMKLNVVVFAVLVAFAILMTGCGSESEVTREPLLDRIEIEDLLVRYYVDLSSGEGHDLAEYFTEDAVLDVNGMISTGREEIEKLYNRVGDGQTESAEIETEPQSKVHMLLNNPVIDVTGDTATAWVIWTGVMNDDIKQPPRFLEQGREYTELVKVDGRWFIQKRYISADSGLPAIWDETYEPRSFR